MEADAGRRATWLELFYDLVYVVVVATLAHGLVAHRTLDGLATFVGLFIPIWWSWVGVALYNDRFDTDDAGHRMFTFVQMVGAALLALSLHDALHGPGFVLAYVFLRALLIAQYLRVARHVMVARPLCTRYALGFGLAAGIWAASLLVPEPLRYGAWAVAMVVDIGTPLTARALQAKLPVSTSHLPERIGLFTIIVLGEAIAAVVRGVDRVSVSAVAAGALGIGIAFSIWWVYFDNLDEHVVRKTRVAGQVWFYAHLPLVMGITVAAVGVEALVEEGENVLPAMSRWLLGGGVALALGALAVIHFTTVERHGPPRSRRRGFIRLGSAAVAILLTALLGGLPGLWLGGALAVVGAAQIALDPPRSAAHAAS